MITIVATLFLVATLESDRSERSFIASLVEARYPTSKVIINSVRPK